MKKDGTRQRKVVTERGGGTLRRAVAERYPDTLLQPQLDLALVVTPRYTFLRWCDTEEGKAMPVCPFASVASLPQRIQAGHGKRPTGQLQQVLVGLQKDSLSA